MGRVLVNGQRTLPHSIMVNRRGRRFTNEAANYNAFGGAFHVEDVSRFEYANLPCWLVFDQNYVDDATGSGSAPAATASEVPAWMPRATRRPSWPTRSASTATSWSARSSAGTRSCAEGHDPDFGRGDSAFDRWWGDPHRKGRPRRHARPARPRPVLRVRDPQRLRSAPRAARGSTPTPGSLDLDGDPIPGLYAAGNAMGSPFGMTYGGPGGTLGPAMVFGYLAGRHATGQA